jgi:hypothetical protein
MKTQAWGWLTAAVLAAGLNASYHDGGQQWAHRIANRVEHNTNAVMALATGRADEFLTEARVLSPRTETSSCQLASALAQVQTMNSWSDAEFDHFQAMSDRQVAQLARLQAKRARIEARVARIRIPAVAFTPVVVRVPDVSVCPRIRVNVPRMPQVKIPAVPVIHIETPGTGPV